MTPPELRLTVALGSWTLTALPTGDTFRLVLADEDLARELAARESAPRRPLADVVGRLVKEDDSFRPQPRQGGGWWLAEDDVLAVLVAVGGMKTAGVVRDVRAAFDQCRGAVEGWLSGLRRTATPTAAPPEAQTSEIARFDRERQRVLTALRECEWNIVKAARALHMPRRTLYRRIDQYGLRNEPEAAPATPESATTGAQEASPSRTRSAR